MEDNNTASVELSEATIEPEIDHRALLQNAPVMICRSGTNKMFDFFNERWLEFTGRSLGQEVGFGWTEGIHAEDHDPSLETYFTAFDQRQQFSMEYRLRRHDGSYRWILHTGAPFREGSADFGGYNFSCIDINARKEHEAELRQAVTERDVLVQELSHRTKNNMQMVSSLLRIYERKISHPEVKSELSAIANRVHLLGVAQEKLQIFTPERVELQDYLSELAKAVSAMVGAERVAVQVRGERATVSRDRAFTVGAVVNELLTNAVQHAFPDDRSGIITVEIQQLPDGRLAVTVADNGRGMQVAPDERTGSVGTNLLRGLARMAGANLRYEVDGGTRCVLTIKPD